MKFFPRHHVAHRHNDLARALVGIWDLERGCALKIDNHEWRRRCGVSDAVEDAVFVNVRHDRKMRGRIFARLPDFVGP